MPVMWTSCESNSSPPLERDAPELPIGAGCLKDSTAGTDGSHVPHSRFLFKLVRRVSALVALATVGMAISSCGDASGCPSFDGHTDGMEIGEHQPIVAHFAEGRWDRRLDAADRYWITGDPTPPGAPTNGQLSGEATLVSDQELVLKFPDGTTVRFGPFSCE